MFSRRLYQSLVNDRNEHPERFNATRERVEEIVYLVLGPDATSVVEQVRRIVREPRAHIDERQGHAIAELLGDECSTHQLNRIADTLMDSEISTGEAIDVHERYKIPVSALEKDIIPVRGDGAWIIDTKGRAYLDMDSNYSATNLGMSNPEIARGLYNQATQLISMKEDRVHIPRTRFLKTIRGMTPEGLDCFYWQNSGGEAVDKAIKIAKAYTGEKGVVAMKGGFHGRTHGAVAVTENRAYREPFFLDDEDWVHFVEFNDLDAIEALFKQGAAKTVILELVQGEEAGIRPAERDFAKKLRKLCDEHGAVMIVDEIQSGFGRTAEKEGQWFASDVYGVVPDIITIGKSFGGGYPVTAVVTNREISDAMQPGYDGSTFGGNPMAMVAAMIATRQMRELNITANVIARCGQLRKGLEKLAKKHDALHEVRGLGLMIAIRLSSETLVGDVQAALRERRVKASLSTREWLRFLPLLVITESDVDYLLNALDGALMSVG